MLLKKGTWVVGRSLVIVEYRLEQSRYVGGEWDLIKLRLESVV